MRCIYCGSLGSTKDHVPPRCLLEKPYPNNLKTVGSCTKCNQSFSLDEQYFLVVLGQIGTSLSLSSKVVDGGSIDRALKRSPGLDERIINALQVSPDGRVVFSPETERINRVVQKIALGIFVQRYRRIPAWDSISEVAAYPYNIEEQRPLSVFLATHTEKFKERSWTHIQRRIFSYLIVFDPLSPSRLVCVMDFHQTLWGIAVLPHPRSVHSRVGNEPDLFDVINS